MPINVLMPALSPTMEKGNLAKWLKKEGDAIKSGDVLAEIETDKATMEVEAVDEGVLAKIVVPEGTADVPVNELIALIAEEGEDPGSVTAGGAQPEKTADAPAKADKPDAAKTQAPAGNETPGGGTMSYERVDTAPEGARPAGGKTADGAPAGQPEGGRRFASPLARRIAKQEGVDLGAVQGSGPHGRIIERDVRAALEGGTAKTASKDAASKAASTSAPKPENREAPAAKETPAAKPAPAAAAPSGLTAKQVMGMFEPGSYEEVPLDGMRKTIAKRLVESKQTVPHFYLSLDVELDALLSLREQVNAGATKDKDGKPAFKLSVNDFVIKALALALQRVPAANSVWAEDRTLRFRHSDVGVAVAIDGGLFTPVIRKAEQKTLSTISAEMKDLAARARTKKLKPEEYQGGTTAVSNLGMFGIKSFGAVINPPHGTILAVGAGEARVVAKNGAPAVVQAMTVTLSCDHRVVDGALGAELLAAFKGLIESPMGMLV
ncbi:MULTISPECIES: 2-oxo acid dehydrogenase subunit E2 [Methylobacterium]|jgi:pyruvate dehydrogenase E2 component (dihydrolipoamide acetyltransferase)|uniref:2-oxo acid dehydrogenase subunit E2 n=4 Tax=Methylobacteriaceae TaxID=119045 RepID=UPI0008E11997|nr:MULTISPECIES: 2-oxo acid dehydrogenase subunit E2 [Methylobacterium]MBK3397567.1 2-oxo acid dehydrogenase subunit E2 [Methylobacterium ajmalii]MBK3411598.1 2-oxo acid dehydrogenase subunit E2 [Methylobacterium ajmalii]MBZ6415911.1 2-oxo acid dehydrogenase subunit E2 [Methylobacterium sp.]SFF48802.1 pyruvate dehydrogenase E2 component (dihydrolipoamide acetyltransferase) [Methylobacterium sp. yr596]